MSYLRPGAFVGAALLLLSAGAAFAAPEAYQVNLGPVARTNTTKLVAVGRGTADITVDGNKMTVSGKFDGLVSAATDAHICSGLGIGVAGVCAGELTVSKGMSGTVTGNVTLNATQAKALKAGQLYIQINSEKAPAPAGNLWGWLLIAHETVGQDVPQQGHWFLPQYDMPESAEHGSTHELKPTPNT